MNNLGEGILASQVPGLNTNGVITLIAFDSFDFGRQKTPCKEPGIAYQCFDLTFQF